MNYWQSASTDVEVDASPWLLESHVFQPVSFKCKAKEIKAVQYSED
jgi:hypothetical protein